jgi:uncharacterized RDD family membrane protein YckC
MAGPPQATWTAPEAPAGPAPGVRFAGHGSRLGAYLIDVVIQIGVGIAVSFIVGLLLLSGSGNDGAGGGIAALGVVLGVVGYFLFSLVYFPWFWSRGGQTPGMKAVEIRVVRDADGGPVSVGAAIMRLIGFWISSFVLYIGFAWILVDARRRGWADLLAGTCVVEAD